MSDEMMKMPTAFEVVYEFTSPFGGVHRKLDSNRWNGNGPTTSQPVYSQDQLIAFAQEATRQAIERAATWVENYPHDKLGPAQTQRLAQDIRSLLSDLDARGKK